MTRVEGIRLRMPSAMKLGRVREAEASLELPGLGRLEDLAVLGDHELDFTFVATTEQGELLARRMNEGRAAMHAEFPRWFQPGMTLASLRIRVTFEAEEDEAPIRPVAAPGRVEETA